MLPRCGTSWSWRKDTTKFNHDAPFLGFFNEECGDIDCSLCPGPLHDPQHEIRHSRWWGRALWILPGHDRLPRAADQARKILQGQIHIRAQHTNLCGGEIRMLCLECLLEGGFPPVRFLRCKGFRLTVIADTDQSLVHSKRKAFDLCLEIVDARCPDGAMPALWTRILEELC
jgi:hypothetical protein